MISGITVWPRHLRVVKICMSGGREWFALRGWSWAEFTDHGRPVEDFEATKDVFALRVATAARVEADG